MKRSIVLSGVCLMVGCSTAPPIPSQQERTPRLALEGEPTGPSLFEGCERSEEMGGVSLWCAEEYIVTVRVLITNGGASRVFAEAETPQGTRRVRVGLETHDAPGFQYGVAASDEETGESLGYVQGVMMVVPQDEEDEVAYVYECERMTATREDGGLGRCLDYIVSAHATPVEVLQGKE